MEIITLKPENLEQEHICCAIANNKDAQVAAKKKWLAARFADGLVFKKGNVRGKCFIEYIPAEKAWCPITAPGYMFIDCLWVSGQLAGQGYANLLLEEAVADSMAKGKAGLVILSSVKKKLPFLSDPAFLKHKGFLPADTAQPYYQLMYLPFKPDAPPPAFNHTVKTPPAADAGFTLYYSPQCPYTAKYVPLIADMAAKKGVSMRTVCFETAQQAQNAPAPFTAYSLFYNGEFITNEILSEKKFEKLLAEKS